jgi:DNA-binding HxlR family transcriptional regulator
MGHAALREVIGKKRTIEILELLETEEVLNYTEIENCVSTSSDVVSDRLQQLVEYGLLHRDEQSAKDVRYEITSAGNEFLDRLREAELLLEK